MFHPDAYGQMALETCLTQLFATTGPGEFSCAGGAGVAPDGLTLTRTGRL